MTCVHAVAVTRCGIPRHRVLLVGFPKATNDEVRQALSVGPLAQLQVHIASASSLPPQPELGHYSAILVHASLPQRDRARLASQLSCCHRTRLVLDLRTTPSTQLWSLFHAGDLRVAALGAAGDKGGLAETVAQMLRSSLVSFMDPVLRQVCNTQQAEFLRQFLTVFHLGRVSSIARELGRTTRGLRRECERLGLRPPHVLLQVLRICDAVRLLVGSDSSPKGLAGAVGYRDASSFRRVVRRTFGATVGGLANGWPDEAPKHLARALLRF